MAPEPSLRTTYRRARDHRRRRRPARQQRASGPARKPQQTGACFAHPPTPLEMRVPTHAMLTGPLEAWLDAGEQYGQHLDWPT